jgi:hypothetical protein
MTLGLVQQHNDVSPPPGRARKRGSQVPPPLYLLNSGVLSRQQGTHARNGDPAATALLLGQQQHCGPPPPPRGVRQEDNTAASTPWVCPAAGAVHSSAPSGSWGCILVHLPAE